MIDNENILSTQCIGKYLNGFKYDENKKNYPIKNINNNIFGTLNFQWNKQSDTNILIYAHQSIHNNNNNNNKNTFNLSNNSNNNNINIIEINKYTNKELRKLYNKFLEIFINLENRIEFLIKEGKLLFNYLLLLNYLLLFNYLLLLLLL